MKRICLAAALLALFTITAFAQENLWVGTWKPDHRKSNYVEVDGPLIISVPAEGEMRGVFPSVKFLMEGRPDGQEMTISFPSLPKGTTETVTMLTPRKLTYTSFVNGKRVKWGTDELSADGKSFTATSWTAGEESRARTEVFIRQ